MLQVTVPENPGSTGTSVNCHRFCVVAQLIERCIPWYICMAAQGL
jgi:hypothetical protein